MTMLTRPGKLLAGGPPMSRNPSLVEAAAWPSLPLDSWQDTRDTLHMWTQIVGKTRLALAPPENHWWQVALYLTPRGLTTSPMPYGTRTVAADFDFLDHRLHLRSSDGGTSSVPLAPRSVADFYADYLEALGSLGMHHVRLRPVPVEVQVAIPFKEDRQHASYDADAVGRWWQLLVEADRLLKRFRGRFLGKASPVHFFWGSFDLTLTRFSGRRAPDRAEGSAMMREAMSHEEFSVGFWPGSGAVQEPAFYAYAAPEPSGFASAPVRPSFAAYRPAISNFILPYERVRTASDRDALVLDFFQSA